MRSALMEFTDYVGPDGTVYSFDNDDRFLISEEGLGMPPMEYVTQRGPFQHGETLVDYRLSPRTIQLVLRQDGDSRYDYWEKRAKLLNMLRPNRHAYGGFGPGKLRKRLPDGSIRELNVIIEQGPVFTARSQDRWDEWGFTETLRFIAHDPTFLDPVTHSIMWENILDVGSMTDLLLPLQFPISLGASAVVATKSILYPGSWPCFPRIIITGPHDNFKLTNLSTGEKIELNYNISAGQIVIINLAFGLKTVEDTLGTNLLGTVTPDSDLATFHLAPDPEVPAGINRVISESTSTTAASRILLEYNARYIGI